MVIQLVAHLAVLLMLDSLQARMRPQVPQQLLTAAQNLSAHRASVEEFLQRRRLRSWLEASRISRLTVRRRCRLVLTVMVGGELVVVLQVVHELIDVEVLESGLRKRENKNKNKSRSRCARNLSILRQ